MAGQTRETAARFSFLLSIPVVAASGLLELREAIHKLPAGSYGSWAVATIVWGIVGYASIWFLLRLLRSHSTGVFIIYRRCDTRCVSDRIRSGEYLADWW